MTASGCAPFGSGAETPLERRANGGELYTGALLCEASVARVAFTRARVDVDVHGVRVAWADASRRGLDEGACRRVASPSGNLVGTGYTWVRDRSTAIRCRVRRPRPLMVVVRPVYGAGDRVDRPEASSVSILVGPRRFLVASATIYPTAYTHLTPSTLSFWPGRCDRR